MVQTTLLQTLRKELQSLANPQKAKFLQRYFKTGKGEYGEGDIFLGIIVSESRLLAKKYKDLSFREIGEILKSKIHEERLIALLILVLRFEKGDKGERENVYKFYLSHTKYINNWDLVDVSADKIVGAYLFDKNVIASPAMAGRGNLEGIASSPAKPAPRNDDDILEKLASSDNIWERRIAIISTWYYIRKGSPDDTFKIAELLLKDKHDLIHKAVGWMLREVGKYCSQEVLEQFLKKHYKRMPRTTLRYAIERFDKGKKIKYLKGFI